MTSAEPSRSADSFDGASTTPYQPEIDDVRGLAVLAVVINHLNHNWLEGSFLGDDLGSTVSMVIRQGKSEPR